MSDAVIDQVLNAKSGQIFVPKDQKRQAGMRKFPIWAQDVIFGLIKVGMKIKDKHGDGKFELKKDENTL